MENTISYTNSKKAKNHSFLIMFIPLFFILMPRPEIAGIHYLTYPFIVFVIMFIILNMTKDIRISKNTLFIFVLLFLLSLTISLSLLINESFNIIDLAKPALYGAVLYSGYFVAKNKDIETIKNSLKRLAYIVIAFQTLVGITQLLSIDALSILYSMEKTRPWGGMVRIAGTVTNPNFFSWVVTQMAVLIWVFEEKKLKKILWIALSLGLVLLSGSRSMLLIFPFVFLFIEIFRTRKTPVFFAIKVPIYILFVFFAYKLTIWFLTVFGDTFPYMRQLLKIFQTGDLDSVGSFEARTIMWENALRQLNSILSWLFGTGGSFNVMDNDYLYAIANYGLFYLIIQLSMYAFIVYLFFKLKDKKIKVLGIQYIVFSLAVGYQVETLSSWSFPILVMFYTGIAISILATNNVQEVARDPVKKKRKRYKLVW